MAYPHHTLVKELEHSNISPPKGSVPPTTLPLTFFDIPWLLFSPNQPLFFYDFPHSTTHFSQTILPNLKQSLSLTLHHFFPLAGSLILPPQPSKPHLIFKESDGLSFEFQESSGDYQFLSGYHPRNVDDFHQLVPHSHFHSTTTFESTQQAKYQLLSVKITFFPLHGFCIGFALRHAAADGRTFDNFLKTWAATYKILHQKSAHLSCLERFAQCHERAMIHDPNNLEPTFLKQWRQIRKINVENHLQNEKGTLSDDMVLATFLVSPPHMQKLKVWILTRSMEIFGSTQLLLSPYVLTCAIIWVCWMKTNFTDQIQEFPEIPHYLGFIAGGIHRLKYLVPKNYFGNCIAFGKAMVKRDQLIGKDGIPYAAKALGDAIKELDREVLGKGNNWISDWNHMLGSELHLMINGSPKVGSYDLDFGWGRPRKVEEISIKKTNAISLCESRDVKGGIEVGLALPKDKMEVFGSLFNEGLKLF